MAELVIVSGTEQGQVVPLGQCCVVGRQKSCELQLPEDAVSREHARIFRQDDSWYVEDLGSSNGTMLNGKPVQRARLSEGDTLKIGHSVLAFREHPPDSQTHVTVIEDLPRHDSTVMRPQDAVSALMGDTTAVRSIDQLQNLHEKLLTVTRFSKEVRATLNLKALLQKVLGLLFEIFPQSERGFVMLHDDGALRPVASRNIISDGEITISATVLNVAINEQKAILSNNPVEDTRFSSGESIAEHSMRSLMVAPLLSADDCIGVIHVDTTKPASPFSSDDLALFSGLADQAAVAVANAHLHERLLRRQRLEQELSIAQAVQRSFLPERFPESDRLELAFHYALARQVGGDFFDLIELPEAALAICIGDVSGKGIPAALLMAKTISEMRVATHAHRSPAAILTMVNSMMLGSISPDMFVTALACLCNPATRTVTVSDAGHNPPIIKRASGSADFLDPLKGFPLGVIEDGQYGDFELKLAPGETLLFYTDGLTDAANDSGDTFGNDRLIEAVEKADPGAQNVVDAVLCDMKDFAGLAKPFDDLTIVAISPK